MSAQDRRVFLGVLLAGVLGVAAIVIVTTVNRMRLDHTIVVRQRTFSQCVPKTREQARRKAQETARKRGLHAVASRRYVRAAVRGADVQDACGWTQLQTLEIEHIVGSACLFAVIVALVAGVYVDGRKGTEPGLADP